MPLPVANPRAPKLISKPWKSAPKPDTRNDKPGNMQCPCYKKQGLRKIPSVRINPTRNKPWCSHWETQPEVKWSIRHPPEWVQGGALWWKIIMWNYVLTLYTCFEGPDDWFSVFLQLYFEWIILQITAYNFSLAAAVRSFPTSQQYWSDAFLVIPHASRIDFPQGILSPFQHKPHGVNRWLHTF